MAFFSVRIVTSLSTLATKQKQKAISTELLSIFVFIASHIARRPIIVHP